MNLLKFNAERIVGLPIIIFLILFPLFSNQFQVGLMGKFIALALFAIALDLIWGYTGLLSLGQAVFFGLGGYTLALSYSFQNGTPQFMKRVGIEEIPMWLKPLENIQVAFALGMIIPAILAAIIGLFVFKSKVTGVYFSLITLLLATVFQMIITSFSGYTGGFNGLMGLPRLPIFGEPLSLQATYYLILGVLVVVYLLTKLIITTHFGKVLLSIRDNENRVEFLGYDPSIYKIVIFSISGLISGLAGMLYISTTGFIGPSDIGATLSISVVLWVAIGGRGNLLGAIIGAIGLNYVSNLLSESFPTIWQLFLGLLMVLVILYMPNGIYGTLNEKLRSNLGKPSKIKSPTFKSEGGEST